MKKTLHLNINVYHLYGKETVVRSGRSGVEGD